jgi:2C-methyl-D-erythritol 2,4-cyclodiphosphate synthase
MKKLLLVLFFIMAVQYNSQGQPYWAADKPTAPTPTVTPYISPSQGGNYNVPAGQTGTPYSQSFIGPIQQQYGAVGTPVSQVSYGTPTPTGGGGGGGGGGGTAPVNNGSSGGGGQQSATPNYDALISQINSMADSSLSALNPQLDAQNAIANNNYTQGVSDLTAQGDTGLNALNLQGQQVDQNQVKTLYDLNENMRNMFQSGSNYLGTRGAGDSTAANEYAYALTKMGNKNRGNVMSQTADLHQQINNKISDLQSQVMQGKQQLETSKNNALQGIAQWFASAQDQIRATKGQNIVQLGQQALNNAMNAINQVNANNQAQQNSLMSWAENNATTIAGLKSNLAQVAPFSLTMPTAGTITGLGGATGTTSSSGQYYPGTNTTNTQKTDIYDNSISQ